MRAPLHLAFLVLLTACVEGAKETKRPDDVLPENRMVGLLTRAHILEAQIQVRRFQADSSKKAFDRLWDSTARKLKTDTATFTRSFNWYAAHVPELDHIYEAVVDSIGVEESRAAGKSDTSKKAKALKRALRADSLKADSIKKAATLKPAARTAPGPGRAAKKASPADTGRRSAARKHRSAKRAKR